jgi:hypothetical protein
MGWIINYDHEKPYMVSQIKMQVSGRLGNQLFEWSFAHHLSKQFNMPIQPVIDSRHFSETQMSIFSDSNFVCAQVRPQIRQDSVGNFLAMLDKMSSSFPKQTERIEKLLQVSRQRDAYILSKHLAPPKLVTGFFINSSHVSENSSHLFGHLKQKFQAGDLNAKLQSLLKGEPFQAVHIRRGDFIPLKNTFGLLSSHWYSKHLDSDLPLVLATDDVDGSSSLINQLKPTITLHPKEWNAWDTLGILSQAKKLILANSTFSWWAGFCAVQNGNTCIAPKPFYKSEPCKDSNLKFEGFEWMPSFFET